MTQWSRSPIKLRDQTFNKLSLPSQRYGSLEQAARLLRTNARTVKKWMLGGLLPDVVVARRGRRPIFDLRLIGQVRVSHSGISLDEAASRVGFSTNMIRGLIRGRDIRRSHLLTGCCDLAIEDIDAFVDSLIDCARPAVPGLILFSLVKYIRGNFPLQEKISLIRAVRDGSLPIYFRGSPALSNLLIEKPLGPYDLIRLYKLRYGEARALIHHLGGTNSVNSIATRTFFQEFEPLRHVAERNGVNTKSLAHRMAHSPGSHSLLRIELDSAGGSMPFIMRTGLPAARKLARQMKNDAAELSAYHSSTPRSKWKHRRFGLSNYAAEAMFCHLRRTRKQHGRRYDKVEIEKFLGDHLSLHALASREGIRPLLLAEVLTTTFPEALFKVNFLSDAGRYEKEITRGSFIKRAALPGIASAIDMARQIADRHSLALELGRWICAIRGRARISKRALGIKLGRPHLGHVELGHWARYLSASLLVQIAKTCSMDVAVDVKPGTITISAREEGLSRNRPKQQFSLIWPVLDGDIPFLSRLILELS